MVSLDRHWAQSVCAHARSGNTARGAPVMGGRVRRCSTVMVKMACDRLDCLFMLVDPVALSRAPCSSRAAISALDSTCQPMPHQHVDVPLSQAPLPAAPSFTGQPQVSTDAALHILMRTAAAVPAKPDEVQPVEGTHMQPCWVSLGMLMPAADLQQDACAGTASRIRELVDIGDQADEPKSAPAARWRLPGRCRPPHPRESECLQPYRRRRSAGL